MSLLSLFLLVVRFLCVVLLLMHCGARYHLYYRPQNQRIYILVQLAVAMAEELELGEHGSSELPSRSSVQHARSRQEWERKRTYVGCYYLSSW